MIPVYPASILKSSAQTRFPFIRSLSESMAKVSGFILLRSALIHWAMSEIPYEQGMDLSFLYEMCVLSSFWQ